MNHSLILLGLLLALLAGCTAPPPTGQVTVVAPESTPAATPLPQTEPASTPPAAAKPVTETATLTESAAPTETVATAPAAETPADATAEPAAESATEPEWLADAQVYRDEVAGFELRYPAGWDLADVAPEVEQANLNYGVTITSWPRQPGGGIPQGGTKLDILVSKSAPAGPMDAAAIRRDELAQDPTHPTITNEGALTLGVGLPATRWQVQGQMGESLEIITAFNGYTVLIAGLGDLALVEEIAATLQPFQ